MNLSDSEKTPQAHESLGDYVRRLRQHSGLSQKEAALKAGIHPQSLGKLERGKTTRLNRKTTNGLAYTLQIPGQYLDAICRGQTIEASQTIKFCPNCWTAGTPPEPSWLLSRAHFCFECGSELRSHCISCEAPVTSLKHRFCPFCGTNYKANRSENLAGS